MFHLSLTGFTVVECLFKLTFCNFIKAHANKIIGCDLRHRVCLLNQLVPIREMLPTLVVIVFNFHLIEMMTSQSIHRFNSFSFVFK